MTGHESMPNNCPNGEASNVVQLDSSDSYSDLMKLETLLWLLATLFPLRELLCWSRRNNVSQKSLPESFLHCAWPDFGLGVLVSVDENSMPVDGIDEEADISFHGK